MNAQASKESNANELRNTMQPQCVQPVRVISSPAPISKSKYNYTTGECFCGKQCNFCV